MNVRTLQLRGFMSHGDTRVELPARGLVLVTGPNRAGKSSLVEAVAVAMYGRTLRGTDPWRDGEEGEVGLVAAGLEARRRRAAGGKVALAWSAGGAAEDYATTTKAQEALERVVGPWDVWRRSAVFSSADSAAFTGATDGERKRLLEAMLGLDQFDPALEACRADLRAAERRVQDLARSGEQLALHLESEGRRLREAEVALAAIGAVEPVADLKARADKLQAASSQARQEAARLRRELEGALSLREQRRAALGQATAAQGRLDRDSCPTCGGEVPAALRASLRGAVERERVSAEEAARAAEEAQAAIGEEVAELEEGALAVERQRAALVERARGAEMVARQRALQERVVAESRAALAEFEAQRGTAGGEGEAARAEHGELRAAERALGLRGVRAHLLGRALGGLEEAANGWLDRLAGPGLRLALKPYAERKSGGIADALSLEVAGAGGGKGYKAASGGERRRIDLAVLLALADVARAAHAVEGGDLYFDEALDALDAEGVAAAARVLADLAHDRKVLVVTHSEALAAALAPDLRLSVEAGKVAVVG